MAHQPATAKVKPPATTTSRDGVVCLLVNAAERRHLPPQPGTFERATERATRRIAALTPAAIAPLRDAYLRLLRPRLGRAAFLELKELTLRAAEWAERHFDPKKGPLRPWVLAALARSYRHLVKTHGLKALQREWLDQQVRDAAAASEEGVLRLWHHVQVKLRRLMTANRAQWYVPGVPPVEFIEDARVEVLSALRNGDLAKHERAGREAIVDFVVRLRNKRRRHRTIVEVLPGTDLMRLREAPLLREDTEAEARVYARQQKQQVDKLPARLTRIQRQWWASMLADVKWHDDLNLSRVAQQMNKHRSSASRAAEDIAEVLRDLLDLDAGEIP